MARGKSKNTDDMSHCFTREQKILIIKDTFPRLLTLELEKAEMQQEHVAPLQQSFTKLARELKAKTGVDRADWWPSYLQFKRDHVAEQMDAAADTDRIQRNLKLMYDALNRGEMVNFLDVIEDGQPGSAPSAFEIDHAASEDANDSAAPKPLDFTDKEQANATDKEAVAEAPPSDWGDNAARPVPHEQDNGDAAGHAFAEGMRAAIAGEADVAALIKAKGWDGRSALAKSFKAGHAAGLKECERAAQMAAELKPPKVDLQPFGPVTRCPDAATPEGDACTLPAPATDEATKPVNLFGDGGESDSDEDEGSGADIVQLLHSAAASDAEVLASGGSADWP
jgi:hypothetical protein